MVATINGFITQIKNDSELNGKFTYSAFKISNPSKRVHPERWDSNQTSEILKQRSFFIIFTETMQGLAGDSLTSIRLQIKQETI